MTIRQIHDHHFERSRNRPDGREPFREFAGKAIGKDAAIGMAHGKDPPRIEAEAVGELVYQGSDEAHVVHRLIDGRAAAAASVPRADPEQVGDPVRVDGEEAAHLGLCVEARGRGELFA